MLTREQISKFEGVAARLGEVDPWGPTLRLFRSLGLVVLDGNGVLSMTPLGEDLLATVPHLPAPEPETVGAEPPCSRCGGDTEVPLFSDDSGDIDWMTRGNVYLRLVAE